MTEIISSRQNKWFKELVQLEKSKERKDRHLFVLEGIKELEMAIQAGYEIQALIYPSDAPNLPASFQWRGEAKQICFTRELFDECCYRKGIPNVLAIGVSKNHDIKQVKLPEDALVLVLESVEKPGNIGAILRTADAVGVSLVILCNMATDLYNPNVIRNSLGCVFTNQIAVMSSEDAKEFLIKGKYNIFTTYLHTENDHFSGNYTGKTAIVFGTESTGVSACWLTQEVEKIKIPMMGQIDSMNVSNSVAVMLYEALRQRLKK